MSDSQADRDLKLIQVLLAEKLISSAQADLATSDGEISGMTIAEVLLARRWVNEDTLNRVAPWLKSATQDETKAPSMVPDGAENNGDSDATYQQNYKKYRQIMDRILE